MLCRAGIRKAIANGQALIATRDDMACCGRPGALHTIWYLLFDCDGGIETCVTEALIAHVGRLWQLVVAPYDAGAAANGSTGWNPLADDLLAAASVLSGLMNADTAAQRRARHQAACVLSGRLRHPGEDMLRVAERAASVRMTAAAQEAGLSQPPAAKTAKAGRLQLRSDIMRELDSIADLLCANVNSWLAEATTSQAAAKRRRVAATTDDGSEEETAAEQEDEAGCSRAARYPAPAWLEPGVEVLVAASRSDIREAYRLYSGAEAEAAGVAASGEKGKVEEIDERDGTADVRLKNDTRAWIPFTVLTATDTVRMRAAELEAAARQRAEKDERTRRRGEGMTEQKEIKERTARETRPAEETSVTGRVAQRRRDQRAGAIPIFLTQAWADDEDGARADSSAGEDSEFEGETRAQPEGLLQGVLQSVAGNGKRKRRGARQLPQWKRRMLSDPGDSGAASGSGLGPAARR